MAEEEHRAQSTTHGHPNEPAAKTTEFHENKHGAYAARDGRRRRALCTFIVVFLVLVGITALVLWLVYRPYKPKFRVVSAAVYELNITSPTSISTTMQFTVVTRNPNKRVVIFYDHLSTSVFYKNQEVTPTLILPPLNHARKSTVALSPVLGGVTVPLAAELVNELVTEEEDYGVMGLKVVITGKLRYKAGAIRTRRHGLYVRCDLLVGLKKGFVGQLPLLQSPPCSVDV